MFVVIVVVLVFAGTVFVVVVVVLVLVVGVPIENPLHPVVLGVVLELPDPPPDVGLNVIALSVLVLAALRLPAMSVSVPADTLTRFTPVPALTVMV